MGSKKKQNRKEQSKKKKNEEVKEDGGGGSKNLITDPRFASVHSDPRFANLSKHKSKVAIDSRFDRMFTDKNFSISSSAHIDKRGKPKKKDSSHNPLKHYYRLEEEEKEETKSEAQVSGESESEEELKKPGGELSDLDLESESDEEKSEDEEEEIDDVSSDTTDSNEEDEISEEEKEDNNLIQEENVPEIDKETHRLAVVNLDWGHVKAVDLYVLLSSFLPKEGQILSVAVYPSEYGLKRMEEESVRGPVGLFDDENEQNDSDDDDEIDEEKLRAYELSRLRYYYAVVECDSIATADYLYKACDGVEFERSSNKLDLRFIPDSMEFKHAPRDVAKEAPADYEGLDFHTRALQHSNIQLTWDEDEPQRVKTLKRKFNADQLAELELKEFLASDESETDEDENDDATEDRPGKKIKKQDLYRALLQSGQGSDEENDDENQDMEVTFNTDLEDLNKHIIEKKDKKSETVWEAHLRKSREKKKARRNRSKNSSEDESSDPDQEPEEELGDFFIEETGGSTEGQGKSDLKGQKHQGTVKETKASIAELELLMADDNEADASLKGYNLKPKKDKVEKKRKKKGKKVKEIPDEEKIPTMDYDDPRFTALFTSPLYALDPTDPQFKRSAAYARQLAQKQRKGDQEELDSKEQEKLPRPAHLPSNDLDVAQNEHLSSKKAKHELSAMVRSIKMKSQQVQFVPSDKITGKNKKLGTKTKK